MKTILLGLGNPYLCDDAVGIRLAGDFRPELESTPDLDIIEECTAGGLEILDVLRGYDRAIVLDSIQTSGGAPGTWYHFGPDALRATLHLANIHDANFATALELGRRTGMQLPGEIHIFAVEVQENRTFSETMTPVLEAKYGSCAAEILDAVRMALR
jgi:hydrogenase maturation protease